MKVRYFRVITNLSTGEVNAKIHAMPKVADVRKMSEGKVIHAQTLQFFLL